MNTKQLSQGTLLYPEQLAHSLLAFADQNAEYKNYLIGLNLKGTPTYSCANDVSLLLPMTFTQAKEKTLWLLENHPQTEAILSEVEADQPRQDPHAVVLGLILGVAKFGVMGHDKPGSKITQVVREDVKNSTDIISSATKSSLLLLERAIAEADGNLKRIEPDMADWFFGEKQLDFFTSNQETLAHIEQELIAMDIPFAVTNDEKGIASLAISPAVNPETASLIFDITEIGSPQG